MKKMFFFWVLTLQLQSQQITTKNVNPNNRQGNGTKFQLAGVNSGVNGALHCNDANGNTTTSACTSGIGSVTSVGLSLPNIFTVIGSPITGSGVFNATFNTQSANLFLAGPASGSAATPTFRV